MFRFLSATVLVLATMLARTAPLRAQTQDPPYPNLSQRLAAPAPAGAQAAPVPDNKPVRITFLHVNDIHGRLEEYNINDHSVGGYARLATAVQAVRAEKSADRVYLIHAGDEFSLHANGNELSLNASGELSLRAVGERSPGENLTVSSKGAVNVALMNQIGFDLWTPGNGEFYGGLGVLRQRFGEFRGQALSANLYSRLNGKMLFKPYVIEEVHGLRIAFFGLNFIHEQHPACLLIRMDSPVETAKKLVPELRKQADFVVAVTHIGLDADRQLAQSVSGIDLIIGGHSHTVLPNGAATKSPDGKDVVIAQAGEYLQYVGRVDLEVARDADGWEIETLAPSLRKLDEKVQIDPTVKATIAKLSASTRAATTQAVPAGKAD